jgi:hypothetical protein
MAFGRTAKALMTAAFATGVASCGTNTQSLSATTTLRDAASATARARSFTLTLAGAEVTYQAPDRVQQVEHGQASVSTGTNGGATATSGPFPETLTKIFIGDQDYEADTPPGQQPAFSMAHRCAGDQNAADYALSVLRAIATTSEATASGDRYAYRLTTSADKLIPTAGIAVVSGGFVLGLTPDGAAHPAITIAAINSAPPVTSPPSSTAVTQTCS